MNYFYSDLNIAYKKCGDGNMLYAFLSASSLQSDDWRQKGTVYFYFNLTAPIQKS